MPSLLSKIKDKLPSDNINNQPNSSHHSSTQANGTTNGTSGSSPERSIPPEPVQQQPHGDFSEHDAQPAMQAHNLARANKRCKKLEWSSTLAREAEAYAQKLAEAGTMEHSGVKGEGENLYMSSGMAELDEAVQAWLGEERSYHGEKIGEGDFGKFGHFTQCLWHSTTHVGMGKAQAENGHTYIVARYSPPGNMQGEKPF